MTSLLIRGASHLVTMDDAGTELEGADIRISDGVIAEIGHGLDPAGAEVIEADGCLVTPGLVNTHHHLYQTLTRAVPGGQDALLFGWLRTLYPIWARFGPEEMFVSAQVGLAELALSGCTMTSDHLYLFPNGARLDDTIAAAREIGLRFHPTRGAMSIGESDGGLPPDALVEREPAILEDCIRVIDAFHDPSPGSMIRVGVAPCSPFSVSRELMRDAALLARDKGVMLHTHLAENDEDIAYSEAMFGCRPGQYAEDLGWTGADVWHAHCVRLDAAEIDLFARSRTGVAHCPCSNCRLGSGIAPVRAMRDAGVKVGLGVDGSASNDAGNLVLEARQAMLLQRVAQGADAMSAREALRIATRGGAEVLGRGGECGQIAPGYRADLAIWPTNGIETAGSWDPAALLLAGPVRVRHLIVEGRQVVRDGRLITADEDELVSRQNRLARALAS
ncbi:8-oxoguanine deaminase [Ponticoccus sp. SC2-23]|uniref:8-oxoguanine deaminase n=1 Tax=Alexandriicola marinus TaxID=2081710 RepID=UPI000FD989A8|nr:8-oxoguanine deaminase [Alexandriicola marinus]MBM1219706.1 8-oxoguanine deaminase [Ponticoccus sp. SC6-9]MBM1223222.1 8-oxoguanine deaminase [Ponticoccus sp. SC6-15]MBM1229519.1 8-oxoguanine deaminase [Ponticoccus sp. SC6-38]MBM1232188.1 8-oxoguanine deaminase [Ponticoccus sp. SC6-45]MBM1237862.1 8-oxoguanine deaminase [Ponticoccus sp. SC6-49]MBM1241199.1 8-oxoguanine deaminase [Ponticoccus sp. SC2-64]MBM1245712.1 8-oxoguanine deaminase [Ponticoccus sp. SC6-42]MBM1250190.1 8-oxoguanine 